MPSEKTDIHLRFLLIHILSLLILSPKYIILLSFLHPSNHQVPSSCLDCYNKFFIGATSSLLPLNHLLCCWRHLPKITVWLCDRPDQTFQWIAPIHSFNGFSESPIISPQQPLSDHISFPSSASQDARTLAQVEARIPGEGRISSECILYALQTRELVIYFLGSFKMFLNPNYPHQNVKSACQGNRGSAGFFFKEAWVNKWWQHCC